VKFIPVFADIIDLLVNGTQGSVRNMKTGKRMTRIIQKIKRAVIVFISGAAVGAFAVWFAINHEAANVPPDAVKVSHVSGDEIKFTPEIKPDKIILRAESSGVGVSDVIVSDNAFPAARAWREKTNSIQAQYSTNKDFQVLYFRRFGQFAFGGGLGSNLSAPLTGARITLAAQFHF